MRRNKPGFWSRSVHLFVGLLFVPFFGISKFLLCILYFYFAKWLRSAVSPAHDSARLVRRREGVQTAADSQLPAVYADTLSCPVLLLTVFLSTDKVYFSQMPSCICLQTNQICLKILFSHLVQWPPSVTCAFADSCYRWYLVLLGIIITQVNLSSKTTISDYNKCWHMIRDFCLCHQLHADTKSRPYWSYQQKLILSTISKWENLIRYNNMELQCSPQWVSDGSDLSVLHCQLSDNSFHDNYIFFVLFSHHHHCLICVMMTIIQAENLIIDWCGDEGWWWTSSCGVILLCRWH